MRPRGQWVLLVVLCWAFAADARESTAPQGSGSSARALKLRYHAGYKKSQWRDSMAKVRASYPKKELDELGGPFVVNALFGNWEKKNDFITFEFIDDQLYAVRYCPRLDATGLRCDVSLAINAIYSQLRRAFGMHQFIKGDVRVDVGGRRTLADVYRWEDDVTRIEVVVDLETGVGTYEVSSRELSQVAIARILGRRNQAQRSSP